MNEIWYTEIWTNEDLEAALENAAIPVTEYAVEKLKAECLHLFDDKSTRNEMLADMVYELQYADKGFFIRPLATSIDELMILRSHKTNWGFSGTKSRLMLNTLTGMVLISMYNADTEKWSVEISDHMIIIPEEEILKNIVPISEDISLTVEETKAIYRWCEAEFRTVKGEATPEDTEYLNSILMYQKPKLHTLILHRFYGNEVGREIQDDNEEHQAIINLPNGRLLIVRHVKNGLPKHLWFFSWRIHCSKKEFEDGKYDSTCGIVETRVTHDFNEKVCQEIAEWAFEEENTENPLDPGSRETGKTVRTPRGLFYLTAMTKEEMEKAGYGFHHESDDGKYLIMTNGSNAYAIWANKDEKADLENLPKALIKVKKKFRLPYYECFQETYILEPGRATNREQAMSLLRDDINNGLHDPNACQDSGFREDEIEEIIICPNCGAETTTQNGFVYCYDCEWEAPIDMLQVITEEEKS